MADNRSSLKSVPQSTAPTYTAPRHEISLNATYFRTGPGIVKLVELLFGIIIMACVAPAWTSGTHWFLFVVVTAFVATLLWSFIYLLNLRSAINLPIDWLLTELALTSIFAVLLMITSLVQLGTSVSKPRPPPRLAPFYVMAGELLNTSITTLLYLIAVIVQFCYIEKNPESVYYSDPGRNITGGIFGIFNTLTYTAGSFFLYRDWKNSHPDGDFRNTNISKGQP